MEIDKGMKQLNIDYKEHKHIQEVGRTGGTSPLDLDQAGALGRGCRFKKPGGSGHGNGGVKKLVEADGKICVGR